RTTPSLAVARMPTYLLAYTAYTYLYTLSLHDALPIYRVGHPHRLLEHAGWVIAEPDVVTERLRHLLDAVEAHEERRRQDQLRLLDRKSTRLNSSHVKSSYAVFCLKKKIQRSSSYRNMV